MKTFDLTLLTALYSLLSCISEAKPSKPTIMYPTRHIVFQASSLNKKPWDLYASFVPKSTFKSAVFTRLLHFDSNYNLSKGIFLDWNWDQESKSYTFTVDTSLELYPNRFIKPQDIEFAFLKKALTTHKEISETQLFNIKGINKLKKGQIFKSGMCSGIKVLGKNKIKIFLTSSNPTFLYALGDSFPEVAPPEDFENDYYTYKKNPRGSGHYKIIWNDKESSLIRLERKVINEHVLKNTSYPLTIDFYSHGSALKNKADLAIGSGANGTKNEKAYKQVIGKVPHGISILEFNYSHPISKNKLFRKAVSLAINRQELFTVSPNLMTTHELIPSMYYGRSNKKFEYNPVKSRNIIKKHFSSTVTQKKPLKGIFHGINGQKLKPYIKVLKQQLESVGIFTSFDGEEGVYFTDDKKDNIFGTYGVVTTFADPLAAITPFIPGSNPNQNTDVSDLKSIKLYEKALKSEDRNERAKYISTLSEHLMDQYRTLPLAELRPLFTYSNRIKKINVDKIFSSINFNLIEMNLKQPPYHH